MTVPVNDTGVRGQPPASRSMQKVWPGLVWPPAEAASIRRHSHLYRRLLSHRLINPATNTPSYPTGEDIPTVIYNITGAVQENIYNNANISAVMFSDNFNYATIANMTPTSINSINVQDSPSDNKIVLKLPVNGDETFSVIAEVLYLGTPDDIEATVADTSLLLMTGIVSGVRDLNVAEDHTFLWWADTAAQTIEGRVVMGDSFYKFETVEGKVLITQFPVDDGFCRFQKGSDGPDPPKYSEPREARKAARRARKELKRLNRKEAGAEAWG